MLKADARLCTSEEEALAAKRHWRREEESDGEEKVAPSVALGTKSRPSTGPTYPCPAGCGRTFNHPPAAAIHGKTCPGPPKKEPVPAPAEAPPPAPG